MKMQESNNGFERKTRSILSTVAQFIIPLCIVFFLIKVVVFPVRVDGVSMYPTIKGGSVVFVSRLHQKYSYGDIVLFALENGNYADSPMVKRVIGEPNQTVVLDGNNVYVDGVLLTEHYATYEDDIEQETLEYVVPNDCYFVLGDNRCQSVDSRNHDIGFIPADCIIGKVIQ